MEKPSAMPLDQSTTPHAWAEAARHLAKADRKLAQIIKRVGPCALAPRRDYFPSLCRAIFAQQLSTKVAATLVNRFRDQFPRRQPTPALLRDRLRADNGQFMRACGLSKQKAGYLLDLSEHFVERRIDTRKLRKMSDHEVIDALVEVKGIGRWTAEMFLIFVLNRPDVLPVDDLGLREGVREIYELRKRPAPLELQELAEPWKPWRSVATWYIWRRGSGGVSLK
jgi:DNA-3-methyladenine glycosylase II